MQRKHAKRRRRAPSNYFTRAVEDLAAGVAGEETGASASEATLGIVNEAQRATLVAELRRHLDAGDDQRNAGEEAERLRLLRVGGMMNQVEVDAVALDAEADRLIAGAAPELTQDPNATAAAPGAGELVSNGLGSWTEVTPGLVVAADVLLLPQWNLREDEKTQLSDALAGVLDQLFPGGLGDARWAPYFRLVAVSMAIALSRRDPITGQFPPLGPMKLAEKTDAAASAGDRRAA